MSDLKSRGAALENLFFGNRDQELLEKLRAELSADRDREALKATTGIDDADALNMLVDQGVTTEGLSALSLVPLVAVAWSDGKLDTKEKDAILKAADASGIETETAAYSLLQSWMADQPDPALFEAWKSYVAALKTQLAAGDLENLKSSIVNRSNSVAKAAGGFVGVGAICDSEKKVIADLGAAFD